MLVYFKRRCFVSGDLTLCLGIEGRVQYFRVKRSGPRVTIDHQHFFTSVSFCRKKVFLSIKIPKVKSQQKLCTCCSEAEI
jgi:hypothetical protein